MIDPHQALQGAEVVTDTPRASALARLCREMLRLRLYKTSVHDHLKLVITRSEEVEGELLACFTSKEIATLMGQTTRAAHNRWKKIEKLELSWLDIDTTSHGRYIRIKASGHSEEVVNSDGSGSEVQSEVFSEVFSEVEVYGTGPATRRAGVTIPSKSTTYSSREGRLDAGVREPVREERSAPASPSGLSEYAQWIRAQVRAAGFMAPADYNLETIELQTLAACGDEERAREFVRLRLSDLVDRRSRGKQVGGRAVEKALREDCHGWKSPSELQRGERIEVKATPRAAGPSQRFDTKEGGERIDRAFDEGAQRITSTPEPGTWARKMRDLANRQMWGVAVDLGQIPRDTPYSEELLGELGYLEEQLEAKRRDNEKTGQPERKEVSPW